MKETKYKFQKLTPVNDVDMTIYGVEGMGPFQIARTLTQEKIETPGHYHAKLGIGMRKNKAYKNPCLWSGTTVSNILDNDWRKFV